jgi:monofunctional biosynthetic peptidoglycan transglycosylase
VGQKGKKRRNIVVTLFAWVLVLAAMYWAACFGELIAFRWVDPPFTTVQVQRQVEAWIDHKDYHRRYEFVPISQISPELQHAIIAAEDGRFYQHHGIDWKEVQVVVDQDLDKGKLGRGGSTITQQLVKNLFFTTHRSILRKAVEFTLAPVAELLLPKQRILELYLNVIEWGPGIYGAEEAARNWYNIPAAKLNREQASRLAALVPSPLRRQPSHMNWYSAEITRRMAFMGW